MKTNQRPKRPAFWDGFWRDTQTGQRLRRVTREELREASRIWFRHADIREGRALEPRERSDGR